MQWYKFQLSQMNDLNSVHSTSLFWKCHIRLKIKIDLEKCGASISIKRYEHLHLKAVEFYLFKLSVCHYHSMSMETKTLLENKSVPAKCVWQSLPLCIYNMESSALIFLLKFNWIYSLSTKYVNTYWQLILDTIPKWTDNNSP